MEPKTGNKKPVIELRYYDLPEHEPALTLQGEEWARIYNDGTRTLHFHNLMEIGICRWGEGIIGLEAEDIPYRDGSITVIPANCPHTTISKDASFNRWVYLFIDPEKILCDAFPDNPSFADAVLEQLKNNAHFLDAPDSATLCGLAEMVLKEYRERSFYHDELVRHLLVSFLLYAAQLEKKSGDPSVLSVAVGLRQITPAIEYINRCYMDPLSVREMAAQCNLSEAHLRRKFQEHLNMSPLEYLTAVRIRRAAELLNSTSYSIPEVALRVGYQSVSSFNRNFQRLTEFSPYQYKKHGKDFKGQLLKYHVSAKRGWGTGEDD